jgi:hypothetical protein
MNGSPGTRPRRYRWLSLAPPEGHLCFFVDVTFLFVCWQKLCRTRARELLAERLVCADGSV